MKHLGTLLTSCTLLACSQQAMGKIVAWYNFEETSGRITADSALNGKDASVGSQLDLDVPGVNNGSGASYTNKPGAVVLAPELYTGNAARSISLWFNAKASLAKKNSRLLHSGSSGAAYLFDLTLENSTGGRSIGLRYGNGNMFWSGGNGGIALDSGFHHVVLTYDGTTLVADSTVNVYIDGVKATRTGGNNTNSGQVLKTGESTSFQDSVYLGRTQRAAVGRFTGVLDDVQVFDNALTQEDVSSLFTHPGELLAGEIIPILGDLNNSQTVDEADYLIWIKNYNKTGLGASGGDLNRDGRVNAADFPILRQAALDSSGVDLAAVPEPASMMLLALGGLLLSRRK